ncbi:MAG: hypothetical protein FJX30_01670 [Alphaproteobacteria bacterium]|nr:hypothetical protein [Alphaproteobacteria bacterium]
MSTNRILPIGFYDLISIEAKKNYEFTKLAVDNFLNNGYELIKTSIVEFVDGYDEKEIGNVFRVIDPISKKNIFFRNDITVQIANYVSSNFEAQFKTPLKLCYYGDIINLNSDELYYERQQTQVGCEIIGDNSLKSCYEVINDTLNVLKNIKNVSITITLPDFLNIFLTTIKSSANNVLKDAIINKRISDVKKYGGDFSAIIAEIILNNTNFDLLSSKIQNIYGNIDISQQLENARELMVFLQKNFPNLSINFDLFGDNKFSYHNKIAFDIFVNNFPYPLAKGGCYSITCGDEILNSVGSTIYINFLRKI